MTVRLLLPLLGVLLSLLACRRGPYLRYVGKTHPASRTAEQLEVYAGREPPDGYRILGVVTARCETYDDTAGLLSTPCDEDTLTSALRARAAGVGAIALLDVRCESRRLRSELERDANVGAVLHNLGARSCQATALGAATLDASLEARQ
jgi:hypothetical protein